MREVFRSTWSVLYCVLILSLVFPHHIALAVDSPIEIVSYDQTRVEVGHSCADRLVAKHRERTQEKRSRFWDQQERKPYFFAAPLRWLRDRSASWMRWWNRSYEPARFAGDLLTANWVARTNVDRESKISKEADERVQRWLDRYENYRTDVQHYYEEVATNLAQAEILKAVLGDKDMKKYRGTNHFIRVRLPVVKDNAVSWIYDERTYEDFRVKRRKCAGRVSEILGSILIRRGHLVTRAIEQAVLSERLRILQNEMRSAKAKANDDYPKDRQAILDRVEALLADEDLNPSARNYQWVQYGGWGSEFWASIVGVQNIGAVRFVKGIYDQLEEAEKANLGVLSPGRFIGLLRVTVLGSIAVGVATAATGLWLWVQRTAVPGFAEKEIADQNTKAFVKESPEYFGRQFKGQQDAVLRGERRDPITGEQDLRNFATSMQKLWRFHREHLTEEERKNIFNRRVATLVLRSVTILKRLDVAQQEEDLRYRSELLLHLERTQAKEFLANETLITRWVKHPKRAERFELGLEVKDKAPSVYAEAQKVAVYRHRLEEIGGRRSQGVNEVLVEELLLLDKSP